MKFKVNTFLSAQFKKFQQHQLGDKQRQLIENWFNEKETAPHKPQVLLNAGSKAELEESLFTGILAGIEKQNTIRWYQHRYIKIAAALVVISMASLLIFTQKDTQQQNQITYRIYETRNGEVKKIMLPDSSTIWMNAATVIKVPKRFTSFNIREIWLEHGEAFFQVKPNARKPFQVKTRNYLTTVLGTSFNIRSYAGENTYQVAVNTGKVKVEKINENRSQLLSAGLIKGQILNFNEQNHAPVIKDGNVENLMAWTSGKNLQLENMDLIQIGKALERQYGLPVKVLLGKEKKLKYTIAFNELKIGDAVQTLALKTGINYQLTNQSLIIKTDR
ncbi:FecR family protein [Agrobacterium tumefaciens]|nr:FecR family protein [Agrobacterium tumefaciens]NTE26299.1 FecR family protein [Agrobacterium tumefaciens]